ncbi:MAG: shikimate kinase [Treponema sp.]|nr:shikimate kinase [Treponema sp.]
MAVIILLGPKHSGKTSTGLELAKLLKIPFYDLDRLIEEKTGKSVRELYKAGEELFQREETAALTALFASDFSSAILSLSGSIIDNPRAMALLKKESVKNCTVYLEVSAETAWQRIISQGELPPFLKAETPAESKEKHRQLHERRASDFKKTASHSICAEGKNAAELAEDLCNLVLYNNKQKDKPLNEVNYRNEQY